MNAAGSSTYKVYYVPRNDYPFRPINTSPITTLTSTSSSVITWGFRAIAMIVLLLAALLM
jgi:hypothetical protein